MKTDVVLIRMNSFRSEPRLIKEYDTLKKLYNCKLLLWNLDRVKDENPDIVGFNLFLPFGSPLLKPAFVLWYLFCFLKLIAIRPKVIHACDLEGGLIAFGYKFFFRETKIVYDVYDVTADKYNLNFHSKKRNLIIDFERSIILKSDFLVVPDESRLEELKISKNNKRIDYAVVYNSVILKKVGSKAISFKNKKIRLTYIGMLSKDIRGIEFLIQLAKDFAEVTVTIAGYGIDEDLFKEKIRQLNLPNIELLGRVSFKEAQHLNYLTDIMVSLLDPTFNNYKFASSTKIFDAFTAMKPIITTNATATARIVSSADWGISIDYGYLNLKEAITKIISGEISFQLDPKRIQKYDWTLCDKKLNAIYAKLINQQ